MKFRFVDMFVLVCVFGMLFGIMIKTLQSATEDARKMQCTQNMAKIAKECYLMVTDDDYARAAG